MLHILSVAVIKLSPSYGTNLACGPEGLAALQKDLEELEMELSLPDKDKCRAQIVRLQLQEPMDTCDLRDMGPEFVKQVLNDPECISQLTPAFLGLLTRAVAANEKNKVSKSEIHDLMSQLGQTSLG